MLNKNKTINKKTYYQYHSGDKMFYVKSKAWLDDDKTRGGIGDGLWRTSIGYMAYGDPDLLDGIKGCVRKYDLINYKNKYWYQFARGINRFSEDDVSRDQIIMALSSLKFNEKTEYLHEVVSHLPYKISRRFNMTPAMWFWVKGIDIHNKHQTLFNFLFQLMLIIELLLQYPISKFFRFLSGFNRENVLIEDKEKKKTLLYKVYDIIEYPGYATHLDGWLFYSVNKIKIISYILKKLLTWEIEDNNYLLQLLIGNLVKFDDINNYQPREEWRWSGKFNGDYNFPILHGDLGKYNTLDKDILWALYKKK